MKKLAVNQTFTLHTKQENKWPISALYLLSSFENITDPKPPDIAFVGPNKFHSICQAKDTQICIVKWLNLLNSDDEKRQV